MKLTTRRYIGVLCRRNHRYDNRNSSIRRWNGDCVECARLREIGYRKKNRKKYNDRSTAYYKKNKKKLQKQKHTFYLKNRERLNKEERIRYGKRRLKEIG